MPGPYGRLRRRRLTAAGPANVRRGAGGGPPPRPGSGAAGPGASAAGPRHQPSSGSAVARIVVFVDGARWDARLAVDANDAVRVTGDRATVRSADPRGDEPAEDRPERAPRGVVDGCIAHRRARRG